jgi:hypothetical protein
LNFRAQLRQLAATVGKVDPGRHHHRCAEHRVSICACVVRCGRGSQANSPAGSAGWITGDANAAASDEFARAVRRIGELLKEFDARGSI